MTTKSTTLVLQKDAIFNATSRLIKALNAIDSDIEKRTKNVEFSAELTTAISDSRETLKKLVEELKELKSMSRTVFTKKRKISTTNLGLRAPQRVCPEIARFINEHGDLPPHLLIEINKQGYATFDRSTMTTFWSYYARKNDRKKGSTGGMTQTDENMNKLFGKPISNPKYGGKTYYQVMVEDIKKLQQSQDYKLLNSNRAQYEPADSDGTKITAFNNSSAQILLKSCFISDYAIPNKEDYVEKLTEIKNHFMKDRDASKAKAK